MSDMTVTLIERIRLMNPRPNHVGEVIPQAIVKFPYIFIAKGSETWSEDLCWPPTLEEVGYDVEVIGTDINQIRTMSSALKAWLMTTPINSMRFTNAEGKDQAIHGIVVDDHTDDYVPRYQDSDEKVHIGSLSIQVITGEVIQ